MDEILEKISHGFNTTVQKVELLSNISRLKFQIKKLERELNQNFRIMGKKVYRMIEDEGYDEIKKSDILGEVEMIQGLNEKIHQLQGKIADLKNTEDDETLKSDIEK